MVLNILNALFNVKYLSPQQLSGFDNYKYSCIDNSPISTYISHPLWNWVVQFYPRWLAPNVLTLCGASIVMACYALVVFFDYDLTANSADSPAELNIPSWVWVVCAVGTFLAHLLDGTDGKQARRTGASGPTGELFDHGFGECLLVLHLPPDLLARFLVDRTIYDYDFFSFRARAVQRYSANFAQPSSCRTSRFYCQSLGKVQHGRPVPFLGIRCQSIRHHSFQFFLFDGFNFAHLCIGAFYVSCVLSLVMSLYNIHFAYWVEKSGKQNCLYEALLPLFPSLLLFGSAIFWGIFSPGKVLDRDPRAFFWTMGVVFSNIAVHLIIAQMSNTRAQTMNLLLFFYTLMTTLSSFNLLFFSELLLLRVSSIVFTLAHLHFGICVIRQLCDHFNIQPFSLAYLQKRDE
uniref:Choline/ethanolaminephosphotransferase 1-like n=1 Tax=Globodera pallida TaxID=36090 RepID=A0A183BIC0_GLOPA